MKRTPPRARHATRTPSAWCRSSALLQVHPAIRRRTTAERRDAARLDAIARKPVFERTPADLAFEDAVTLGETYPETAAATLAGFLAGVRIAERRTGRDDLLAAAIRAARATLRRGGSL